MKEANRKFPIFLKYPNDKSFFKICSAEEFEQIIYTGNIGEISRHKANNFANRLLISDMIENTGNYWVEILEDEYEWEKQKCKADK